MDATLLAWLEKDPDPCTRAELQALAAAGDTATLARRFSGRIGFGTAGLRALMGAGPTRMNRLVVQESTVGLGEYVMAQAATPATPSAVVGFDARHHSQQFAYDTAAVLATLGFVVYLFDREVPTPVAGFAVRQLQAAVGVVITASHNPPGYNGYKVYWHNGAQIVAPHDTGIARAIAAASCRPVPPCDLETHRASGQVRPLGEEMEQDYLSAILTQGGSVATATPTRLRVAYTPLHGVGARFAEATAQRLGFVDLQTVPEQRAPDGAFPTVRFPNPEEPGAMEHVLALARNMDADIACANDPDADRLAVAVRAPQGGLDVLNGDELGALLGDARMQQAPANAVVATTIASSRLLQRIAAYRKVAYFETLTGFKWIANGGIARQNRGQRLIFGYEEALGYILGDTVWDKDGIAAFAAICTLAQALKAEGKSLQGALEALYRRHGLFLTAQKTVAMPPAEALKVSRRLRVHPPAQLGDLAVEHITDLAKPTAPNSSGTALVSTEPNPLPRSDVLIYTLSQGARIVVRPSGTEPKVKCYYEVYAPIQAEQTMASARESLQARLNQLCETHQYHLSQLVGQQGTELSI